MKVIRDKEDKDGQRLLFKRSGERRVNAVKTFENAQCLLSIIPLANACMTMHVPGEVDGRQEERGGEGRGGEGMEETV